MRTLYLDEETIPCQLDMLRDEITKPVLELHASKAEAIAAEIADVRPPSNYKDPVKIADWMQNEKPKKIAALEDQKKALAAECEQKVDEAWRKTSFDGAYCQIVVFGWAFDDQPAKTAHSGKDCLTLGAEARLIREFYQALEMVDEKHRAGLTWVGHNILDFDLRVLYQRSVVHGIRPPHWIPFDAKPWGDQVFDTMLAWAGPRGRVGQDKVCRVLGIDAKGSELGDDIDGSKVWDFVKAGRIADVATYCAGDVNRAREMHRRLTFAQAA